MQLELPDSLNTQLLVVDDNHSIHEDFKKTLFSPGNGDNSKLDELEEEIFNREKEEVGFEQAELTNLAYSMEHAYQGEEALEIVRKRHESGDQFALIFMDVRMPPGIDGIQAIRKIWAIDPYIEIIICTAYSDYSWNEVVKNLGNTDKLLFLKKPFSPVEVKQMAHSLIIKWNLHYQYRHLITNLENEVKSRTKQLEELYKQLETANRNLEEKNRILEEVAQRDSLTGLFNHVALNERLRSTLSEAQRHEFPLSVVMIDIDYFKEINDNYGHQTGDAIIKKFSSLLQINLRDYDVKLRYTELKPQDDSGKHCKSNSSDSSTATKNNADDFGIAGRYGGDEFIVILPHCGHNETVAVLERLQKNIHEITLPDSYTNITTSIGAAVLHSPEKCHDYNDLIKLADQALYEAKNSGRDCMRLLDFDKYKQ